MPLRYMSHAYEERARQPFGLHAIVLKMCEKKNSTEKEGRSEKSKGEFDF